MPKRFRLSDTEDNLRLNRTTATGCSFFMVILPSFSVNRRCYNKRVSTPLFVRSSFTLLSSLNSVSSIVENAIRYGYDSVALVDRNVLSGAMTFRKECAKRGIRPLFGLEFTVLADERKYQMMFLARDDEGFLNLMKLSTYLSSGHDCISVSEIGEYRNHNFLILFSDDCPLSVSLEKMEDGMSALKRQKDLFGDHLMAMSDLDKAHNANIASRMRPLLKQMGIRAFALSRCFYPERDDAYDYEILRCIRDHKLVADLKGVYESGRHFLSREEYDELYDHDEQVMSDMIAARCDVKLEYSTSLPDYSLKDGVDSALYLRLLCREGLKRRLKGRVSEDYARRLEYELETIVSMGFADYFLIVYDFILYAKKNGIYVGPGRGSAAGSLASYCLGITEIDPLKYGLLFERFLNPERVTMPDIDTDFPDDRRDEVIAYVRERYGRDHVAHIITYGTLKARQVIRDVGRVLNYPIYEIDTISKLIPSTPNITLSRAYEEVASFRKKIDSDRRFRDLFRISLKLEGFPRHESTHAAGIVMSKKPLSEVVPLIAVESDLYSTQYTMEHLEEMGLIKMDFLGLRNLSIIAEVASSAGVDMRKIPLNDPKTMEMIRNVDTLGIFQLESAGMMNLIRKLKPQNFEDIGVVIALFRPGPMENIPVYLDNRSDPKKIDYLHKDLVPVLKETYGIIVYQEQIMSIARLMAGFSYGKADILRRAMSKKKASELEKMSDEFISGCIARGYSKELAVKVYDLILRFANYGFNKSHSVAYARTAYEMAYLKANYPLYFYRSLLNGSMGSSSKTYEYISECESNGNSVKCPDINLSSDSYVVKNGSLIMPFGMIRDVGSAVSQKIIAERDANGLFRNYGSAVDRLVRAGIEGDAIASMISAGAFDSFDYSRFTMYINLPLALEHARVHRNDNMDPLFRIDDDEQVIREVPDDLHRLAENEKTALGFYMSYNPVKDIRRKFGKHVTVLSELSSSFGRGAGLGMIDSIRNHRTKRGDIMAFAEVSDDTSGISLVIMPDVYSRNETVLKKGSYIYFEGLIEKEGSMLVKKVEAVRND